MSKQVKAIVHVGPGLHAISAFSGDTNDFAHAKRRLALAMQPIDATLTQQTVDYLVAPEALQFEKQALVQILKQLRAALSGDKVLSVLTFSEAVVGPFVNALHDLNLHEHLRVVLHRGPGDEVEGKAYTVHKVDKGGFLLDWPYGVLLASLDWHDLPALGFPEVKEIKQQQELERQARFAQERQDVKVEGS